MGEKNGMSGNLDKLLNRIGIVVTRLADMPRNGGSGSRAKREARFLMINGQKMPGLAMLLYLYEKRVGEGVYESLLLSEAANLGARYERDSQSPRHQQDVHALEILWSMIIVLRTPMEDGEKTAASK
ncbi:hypothetical protein ABK905_26525 [Acerihabitans sp. KWT182]|uniref:CRISPR type III-B/RAMP module-associated protein Cmr5 n=1 Tax=Acerihabitans sp. KWT182 TaxID=3157919 RepID=A0AAU7Q9Q3_9GAMM